MKLYFPSVAFICTFPSHVLGASHSHLSPQPPRPLQINNPQLPIPRSWRSFLRLSSLLPCYWTSPNTFLTTPSRLFFLFRAGSAWAGAKGEGKSPADGAGKGSPWGPRRAPRALVFLSLKRCVHNGLASAFQLGNRDLFTFALSTVPTRI